MNEFKYYKDFPIKYSKEEGLMNEVKILQLVTFKLGSEEFGVDILKVQEINKMMNITKIPNAPVFIEGVINLRGKIIPIVDLRKRLGFNDKRRSLL